MSKYAFVLAALSFQLVAHSASAQSLTTSCVDLAGNWENRQGVQFRIEQEGCETFRLIDVKAPGGPVTYDISPGTNHKIESNNDVVTYSVAPMFTINSLWTTFNGTIPFASPDVLGGKELKLPYEVATSFIAYASGPGYDVTNHIQVNVHSIRLTDRSTLLRRIMSATANFVLGFFDGYYNKMFSEDLRRI